jgi:hypothetical protein
LWSDAEMTKRLNHERRRFEGRRTLNVRDEYEFRRTDFAAQWLATAERNEQQKRKQRLEQERRKQEQVRLESNEPPPWDD